MATRTITLGVPDFDLDTDGGGAGDKPTARHNGAAGVVIIRYPI